MADYKNQIAKEARIIYNIRQKKSKRLWKSTLFYYTIEDARNGETLVHSEMLTKQNMQIASQRFFRDLSGSALIVLGEVEK